METSKPARRPRPQVMRITDAAAERVREIIANSDKALVGVRVGCAGMSYTMDFAEQIDRFDEVVEDKGVKIVVDPKAVMFLLGTEMDYRIEKMSAGFVFNNPNQTSACGCGESVAITPVSEDAAS
jgi:iron-sulfur cluster assembly protein